MKCKILILLLVSLIAPIYGKELKIGYIDSQRILEGYKGRQELERAWQKKLNEWKEKAMSMREKIEKKAQEIEAQRLLLSEEALREKQQELQELQVQYEEFIQQIWGPGGEAYRENQEIMRPLTEKVNAILERLSKEEGYDIIFDVANMGIVFAKPEMDLTERVLEELNREYAKPEKEEKKLLFWVFKLKELTQSAKEKDYGTEIKNHLIAILGAHSGLEAPDRRDMSYAITTAPIGDKKEEDYTLDDILSIARIAKLNIVIRGEIKEEGNLVEITLEIISVEDGSKIGEATAKGEVHPETKHEDLERLEADLIAQINKLLKLPEK